MRIEVDVKTASFKAEEAAEIALATNRRSGPGFRLLVAMDVVSTFQMLAPCAGPSTSENVVAIALFTNKDRNESRD
jgi:hypothetical protein